MSALGDAVRKHSCLASSPTVYNIVHLIYRAKAYEGHSKDYEFSRLSIGGPGIATPNGRGVIPKCWKGRPVAKES